MRGKLNKRKNMPYKNHEKGTRFFLNAIRSHKKQVVDNMSK